MPTATSSPPETIHTLYSENHVWLRDWLRRRVGCSEQAADLAHDTFVRMLLGRHDPATIERPRAFLTTIAHSLMVNHWRRKDIERAYLDVLAAQSEAFEASPEEQYQIVEALLEIDRLLNGLSPQVGQIFLLSQLDGLTYPVIAAQLGLSVNQVQKAMVRAMHHCYVALYECG